MPKCLIIGCGNPLRSDDGFGWKAALTLEREMPPSDIKVMAVQQLTPDLAQAVAKSPQIFFLDASHEGEPGEFRVRPLQHSVSASLPAIAHHLSPAALLELAYQHFGVRPKAALFTVTGENFEFGESFSSPVENAWKRSLDEIRFHIRTLEDDAEDTGAIGNS